MSAVREVNSAVLASELPEIGNADVVVSKTKQESYIFAVFLRHREPKVPPSGALWLSSETCSFSKELEDAPHLASAAG